MTDKVVIIQKNNPRQDTSFENFLKVWQFEGWLIFLDLALLLTAVLLLFTPAKVLFFHCVFILLTFGAFFWDFRPFAVRAIFWVTITTVAVMLAILASQTQVDEIIEIPLLTTILILVFFIAEQRSRAQRALQLSEERYQTLFDNVFEQSRDAILIADQQENVLQVNQAMLDMLGCTRDDLIGLNYSTVIRASEDLGKFRILMERQGYVSNFGLRLENRQGAHVFCLLTVNKWQAKDGRVLGYQAIIRDISQRKKTVEALRESEDRYRRLIGLSFEGVVVHADNNIEYLNSPAATILGATSTNMLIGRSIFDFVHPAYLKKVQTRLKAVADERIGVPLVEEKFVRLDKTTVDVEIATVPITFKGRPAMQSVIRDITPRKNAEAEREHLLATERRQRQLAEILGEVFLALTAQTSYEAVLDEILHQVQLLVSYSAANIVLVKNDKLHIARHRGYDNFANKNLISKLEQSLADFPLDAKAVRSGQTLVVPNTDQDPRWVAVPEAAWIKSFVVVPILLRDRVLGLLRLDSAEVDTFSKKDIGRLQPLAHAAAIALENARLYDMARQELADRIEVEKELRKVAAKNQAVLNVIPDAIFQFSYDGRLLDYKVGQNTAALGFLSTPSIGTLLGEMPGLSSDLAEIFVHNISKTVETNDTQIFDFQLRLPQGIRDFEAWLVVYGPQEVLAIVRDVTERKLRTEALEAERSRIARHLHDTLGQNIGYLRLKLDEFTLNDGNLPQPNALRQELIRMRDVANEAYELVRSILAAAHLSNSGDLATVLFAKARVVGHRGRFKVNLTNEGQTRRLSPVIQQQVFYIFQEALNNIEKYAQAQNVAINIVWTDDRLIVKLIDDGCGFESYTFTQEGHFGLVIMRERAEEIQGLLSINSTVDVGTEVTLQLPLAAVTEPFQAPVD
ncbi:MAG: PAS domain S-box protein [Anaerolineae bacterium]|nr:PAS domain S-box protein [Anaerolineae bacterium]